MIERWKNKQLEKLLLWSLKRYLRRYESASSVWSVVVNDEKVNIQKTMRIIERRTGVDK